jgi:hypothetical protein
VKFQATAPMSPGPSGPLDFSMRRAEAFRSPTPPESAKVKLKAIEQIFCNAQQPSRLVFCALLRLRPLYFRRPPNRSAIRVGAHAETVCKATLCIRGISLSARPWAIADASA